MEENPEEVDHRQQLRAMGTIELTYLWEEPMSPSAREQLLAELRERRYRIKSLPDPPAGDELPEDGELPGTKPVSEPERAERRVRNAVGMILFVAVLSLGFGILQGVNGWSKISARVAELEGLEATETVVVDGEELLVEDARFALGIARVVTLLISLAPGLVFFALAFLARIAPRPAILTALALYVAFFALSVWLDPSTAPRGIALKILVVMTLIWGLRATYRTPDPEEEPEATT